MSETRKHILIADSDEEVLIKLERLLQDQGHETATAWGTDQALRLLESRSFDLILVSDHPPELSCKRVLTAIQALQAGVPAIVLESTETDAFAEQHFTALGASAFVNKWRHPQILEIIQQYLDPENHQTAKRAVAG